MWIRIGDIPYLGAIERGMNDGIMGIRPYSDLKFFSHINPTERGRSSEYYMKGYTLGRLELLAEAHGVYDDETGLSLIGRFAKPVREAFPNGLTANEMEEIIYECTIWNAANIYSA